MIKVPRTVYEIINIMYPDESKMTEEDFEKRERCRSFLTRKWGEISDDFREELEGLDSFIEKHGESETYRLLLDQYMRFDDEETIIINFTKSLFNVLNTDSFIANSFLTFVNLIRFERDEQERSKDMPLNRDRVSLDDVYRYTEDFLREIDKSGRMADEFVRLKESGRIVIVNEKGRSEFCMKTKNINYYFDGTFNTANTLIHEFMHYWVYKCSNPTNDRENHTIFNEFESIYYEIAFSHYLEDEGIIPSAKPLIADRLQYHYNKDPNNVWIMMLELCTIFGEKGRINKQDIMSVLSKHFDIKDKERLWQEGSKVICDELSGTFPFESMGGPIMYRMCHGLALNTPYKYSDRIHILSHFISDRSHDDEFMQAYSKLTENKSIIDYKGISSRLLSVISRAQQITPSAISNLSSRKVTYETLNEISRFLERVKDRKREK